jgi:hypothetical protein
MCLQPWLAPRTASIAVTEIKATIDGAYILEEWHDADRVFRPPQVEGRFTFLNEAVGGKLFRV